MRICIINGPNLNLLGKREPEIYGVTSFETFLLELQSKYPSITIDYFQDNVEGEIEIRCRELGLIKNTSRGRELTEEGEKYIERIKI